MTTALILLTIIQSFSISLGVGSSTLAIINFFAAIADGVIDETERRMMGIVYVVLRVAMVLILFSSLLLFALQFGTEWIGRISAFEAAYLITLGVLFVNAILMTLVNGEEGAQQGTDVADLSLRQDFVATLPALISHNLWAVGCVLALVVVVLAMYLWYRVSRQSPEGLPECEEIVFKRRTLHLPKTNIILQPGRAEFTLAQCEGENKLLIDDAVENTKRCHGSIFRETILSKMSLDN